jgi:hypothetical protein
MDGRIGQEPGQAGPADRMDDLIGLASGPTDLADRMDGPTGPSIRIGPAGRMDGRIGPSIRIARTTSSIGRRTLGPAGRRT